jgi:23S rRNA pseudouridine1911/1915/1917 synthase
LDKETSGLLIVAKHDKAHRLLNQAFAARQVVKKYWAFVWGTPKPHFGRIHTRLSRHPTMRTHQAVVHGSVGKEAITTYRVVRRHDSMSVLECGLLTGRTHQIRVHCAHIGHPIVGDAMYGHKKPWDRHGLHAHFLEIAHPIHGTIMQLSSPLPPDLQALWNDMTPL